MQDTLPPPATPVTPAPTERVAQKIAHHEHRGFIGWVRRIGGFIYWLLTGFGLVGAIFGRKSSRSKAEEIVVYCVHRSFFLWALIITGFAGALCASHWPATNIVWGWVYIAVLLCTFCSLLFDVNSFKFLLWAGIFAFIWLLSKYLEELKHIPVLTSLFAHLRGLHPILNPGFAAVVSWLLLGPWIGAMFASFSRGRKTFSPNSIEEWYMGEGREITDRSGLKFHSRYRDLFETVLGLGAGDLEAVDGTGKVVKKWENVLFLMFSWNKLDEILHQRSAVVDNAKEDPVEVEDVRKC